MNVARWRVITVANGPSPNAVAEKAEAVGCLTTAVILPRSPGSSGDEPFSRQKQRVLPC